ncbi:hypothetical protein LSAT2_016809 [Lamellibrachia satsuma]|nr:hypothetical protein LSAT2_016809 [Lamellibrachia satsuma]
MTLSSSKTAPKASYFLWSESADTLRGLSSVTERQVTDVFVNQNKVEAVDNFTNFGAFISNQGLIDREATGINTGQYQFTLARSLDEDGGARKLHYIATWREKVRMTTTLLAVVSAFIAVSLMVQPIAATTCKDLCHVEQDECNEKCYEETWTHQGKVWSGCNSECSVNHLMCMFECRSTET